MTWAATGFPILRTVDLRNLEGALSQELGGDKGEGLTTCAGTLEDARLLMAMFLLKKAEDHKERCQRLHERFCGGNWLRRTLRTAGDLATRKIGKRRAFTRELTEIREHVERILAYEDADWLATDLESVIDVSVEALEGDLDLPRPIYGKEQPVVLYRVHVPLYVSELNKFWIQKCLVVEVEIDDCFVDRKEIKKAFRSRYRIKPQEGYIKDRKLDEWLKHDELHALISGEKSMHSFSLMGHYLFAAPCGPNALGHGIFIDSSSPAVGFSVEGKINSCILVLCYSLVLLSTR